MSFYCDVFLCNAYAGIRCVKREKNVDKADKKNPFVDEILSAFCRNKIKSVRNAP